MQYLAQDVDRAHGKPTDAGTLDAFEVDVVEALGPAASTGRARLEQSVATMMSERVQPWYAGRGLR